MRVGRKIMTRHRLLDILARRVPERNARPQNPTRAQYTSKFDDCEESEGESGAMQVKLAILPAEDGLNVIVWAKWATGTMRVRHFQNRSEMIETLVGLRLIGLADGEGLGSFVFSDTCPLFSSEIDEAVLAAHGFEIAQ